MSGDCTAAVVMAVRIKGHSSDNAEVNKGYDCERSAGSNK